MILENVLSCFDGISCGRVALNRAGIGIKNYYSSEIDKHASAITRYNYPDTIHLGDISKLAKDKLPESVDLLMGGFPCQGFYSAGQKGGFEDIRSKLFFDLMKVKENVKPKYFLFENVVMKEKDLNMITNLCGVEPIILNSKYFSAQSRNRVYWTNIGTNKNGLLGDFLLNEIKEPDIDHKDLLIDILEEKVDAKYQLSESILSHFISKTADSSTGFSFKPSDGNKKAFTLTTRNGSRVDDNFINIGNGKVRKLTPIECERLQGLPDNFTKFGIDNKGSVIKISDTQRFKTLGNGWNVPTISYILKYLK